jgi:hypothetical protein
MSRLKVLALAWAPTLLAVVMVVAPRAGRADVTIQEQTSFDFSVIQAHGSNTEYTSADKQRRDTELNCEGFMSLVCGNAQTGNIIRLDRGVQWQLEPKKKEYRETPFLTAAQRQAALQQAQAEMDKMKQCPAVQQKGSQAPDTSKCEMSPPKFDLKQPGTHATIAGHDSQLTQLALTQSCTNKQTGDTCDFLFMFDSWLTQDQIAGLEDRRAFALAYAQKLGLDEHGAGVAIPAQMRQFIAPYAEAMKQLGSKVTDIKGYPLKTTVRIAFGGEHCAAAKNSQSSGGFGNGNNNSSVVGDASQAGASAGTGAAAGAAGSSAGSAAANAAGNGSGGSVLGSAASAFSNKLVSGLFAKKNNTSTSGASGTSTTTAGGASALPPGMTQAAVFTTETTVITQGPIAGSQFDIPAGWKLDQPPPTKAHEFTCPKSGS